MGKIVRLKGETEMSSATMITVKPIEATPTLKGEDAKALLNDAMEEPSKYSIERNDFLYKILEKIRG